MNEDDLQQRGCFRSLVLMAFAAYVWCAVKFERLLDSEAFWWWLSGILFAMAAWLLGSMARR